MIYVEKEHNQPLEIEEINYLIYKVLSIGQSVMRIRDIHDKQRYGQRTSNLLVQQVYLPVNVPQLQLVLSGVQQEYFCSFLIETHKWYMYQVIEEYKNLKRLIGHQNQHKSGLQNLLVLYLLKQILEIVRLSVNY